MFDIGMTEILVVAVVAIVVVGPKDLPGLLRNGARYLGQLRSMARDFQGQLNQAIKESELDDVRNSLRDIGDLNPVKNIKNEVSDYMDSARALDLPDDDYVAEGEAMAKAADARPQSPAQDDPAPESGKQVSVAKAGDVSSAAKVEPEKTAPSPVSSVETTPAERSPAKTSS